MTIVAVALMVLGLVGLVDELTARRIPTPFRRALIAGFGIAGLITTLHD